MAVSSYVKGESAMIELEIMLIEDTTDGLRLLPGAERAAALSQDSGGS